MDSFTEPLGLRRKAWIELFGCLLFALPYCLLLSVLARVVVFLFGGRPQDEVNLQIGSVTMEV